ncbi:thiamine pyrophosphate-binding protein [Thermodesulfobacteriota bacterium]
MKTSELVVELLEEAGVRYVFGVPGGAIEELNIALYNNGTIRPIVAKHEGGAAFMADGYARVSGKLGVCCATAGPGATNLITALACSYADSVPVCALTGQVATSVFGKGAIQESGAEGVNLVSIFGNFTKYSGMLFNVKRVQYMVEKAIRVAMSGRMGPVHLSLPVDVMKLSTERVASANKRGFASKMFERQGVQEAARILLAAKRPAIIVGWGAGLSQGAEALLVLARLLKIPVATSPKAKGMFPESDPLSLGCLGFAGSPVAKEYVVERDVDVLLAVGTSFNEWMTSGWDTRLHPTDHLIQIDVDEEEIGKNYPVSLALTGDARTILKELLYAILRDVGGTVSAWQDIADVVLRNGVEMGSSDCLGKLWQRVKARGLEQLAEVGVVKEEHLEVPIVEGEYYHPRALVADVQSACPAETIYFADMGATMAWAIRYMVVDQPYSFHVPLGFSSMGHSVAAAVGAKLACPDRPVVALVGDGCFLMHGMEVATAVEYDIPVIWVIFNNGMLGMVHHGRKLFNPQVPEGLLSGFRHRYDFVKVAEGLGARGIRIKEPGGLTPQLLAEVIAAGQPTVIDVWIDETAVPPIHSRIEAVANQYK